MKTIKTKTVRLISLALALLCLFALLCSCGPIFGHPDNLFLKHPNVEWTCRELDMVAYTLDYRMFGFCTLGGQTYSVVVRYGLYNFHLGFDFYTTTEKKASEYNAELIRYKCESESGPWGKISYQEDTETLVFTQDDEESVTVNGVEIPRTLTFDKTGSTEGSATRYVADGMDFSLQFSSRDAKVLKGTIVVDGKEKPIFAYPLGDDGYYWIDMPYGVKIGEDIYSGELIRLSMEFFDDRIEATVCDVYNGEEETFAHLYPVWHRFFYDVKTVTFHATPTE